MSEVSKTTDEVRRAAKAAWDAEREQLRREAPEWDMPAWSRAPAWRRRPYILDAQERANG